jgi:hypothetical protein
LSLLLQGCCRVSSGLLQGLLLPVLLLVLPPPLLLLLLV